MGWEIAGTDPSGATIMRNEFGETQLVAAQAAPGAMAPYMNAEPFPAPPDPGSLVADSGPMMAGGGEAPAYSPSHGDYREEPIGFGIQNLPDPSLDANRNRAVFASNPQQQPPLTARTGTPAYVPPEEPSILTAGKSLAAAEEVTRMMNGPRRGGGRGIGIASKALAQASDDRVRAEDDAAIAKIDENQANADRSQEIGARATEAVDDTLSERIAAEELDIVAGNGLRHLVRAHAIIVACIDRKHAFLIVPADDNQIVDAVHDVLVVAPFDLFGLSDNSDE